MCCGDRGGLSYNARDNMMMSGYGRCRPFARDLCAMACALVSNIPRTKIRLWLKVLSLKGLLTIRRLSLVDTATAFLLCLAVTVLLPCIISVAGVLEDWEQGRRFGPHYVPIDCGTKGQDNLSSVPGHYSLKLSELCHHIYFFVPTDVCWSPGSG